MSLTRRTLLGALAALVAAPAAAILARKPARDAFGGPPTGAHFDAVIFDDVEVEPHRLHPIGTKVRQAYRFRQPDRWASCFDMELEARKKLDRWGQKYRCRRVSDYRLHVFDGADRVYAVLADFVQE